MFPDSCPLIIDPATVLVFSMLLLNDPRGSGNLLLGMISLNSSHITRPGLD